MLSKFHFIFPGNTFSTYALSTSSALSSNSASSLYLILASLVIPAGKSNVAIYSGSYISTYLIASGLVPTKLILPFKTSNTCGSSSSLQPLSFAPTLVIRLSLSTVTVDPILSALLTIVRNLCILKCFPYAVTLSCL